MFDKLFVLLIMQIYKLLFAKKEFEMYKVISSDMFPPAPSCLLNIQQSSLNKKTDSTVLQTKHYITLFAKKRTLFIISPVLLGISTRFKNLYIIWGAHMYTYIGTETHRGCVLLLRHPKLVTWRTSASADWGGGGGGGNGGGGLAASYTWTSTICCPFYPDLLRPEQTWSRLVKSH